jgi:hypothetical protein
VMVKAKCSRWINSAFIGTPVAGHAGKCECIPFRIGSPVRRIYAKGEREMFDARRGSYLIFDG